jgi:hypothetical protein
MQTHHTCSVLESGQTLPTTLLAESTRMWKVQLQTLLLLPDSQVSVQYSLLLAFISTDAAYSTHHDQCG